MAGSSSVLLPPGGQRILVVQAHPDDAEHLCGGTMALLAEEGKDIKQSLHYSSEDCFLGNIVTPLYGFCND